MNDFWLSCGHHLLDRDEGGGLCVTDEFIMAYLARPELKPPPEARALTSGWMSTAMAVSAGESSRCSM